MSPITTQSDEWIGSAEEIESALAAAGADLDDSDKFRFAGPACPMLFGNEADILVTDRTFYFVNGEQRRLVDLLVDHTGRAFTFNQYA